MKIGGGGGGGRFILKNIDKPKKKKNIANHGNPKSLEGGWGGGGARICVCLEGVRVFVYL